MRELAPKRHKPLAQIEEDAGRGSSRKVAESILNHDLPPELGQQLLEYSLQKAADYTETFTVALSAEAAEVRTETYRKQMRRLVMLKAGAKSLQEVAESIYNGEDVT